MSFSFIGKLPASKSLMNRALLAKTFLPSLEISGESKADDVIRMIKATESFVRGGHEFDVGQAGTVLRFLALRVAREKGMYHLRGTERLMQRPQDELERTLAQLGCQVKRESDTFSVRAFGWHFQGDGIYIRGHQSSQFASALILSAWDYDKPIFIHIQGDLVSRGYLEMTMQMMRELGMNIEVNGSEIHIPAYQRMKVSEIRIEEDLSSTFAIAAVAAVSGQATFKDFPPRSLQPDIQFTEFLQKLGVHIERDGSDLKVAKPKLLNGAEFFIQSCPDTFPVLSSLCFLANGESRILGGSTLKYKESDRLAEMANLFMQLGRKVEIYDDGIGFSGDLNHLNKSQEVFFDVKEDHRLAMAAAVLNAAGFRINMSDKTVVNKSLPEFWDIIGDQT